MVFHSYNAAISVSAVNTHSFSAFVYHHSTFARACQNNCVWRIKPSIWWTVFRYSLGITFIVIFPFAVESRLDSWVSGKFLIYFF